MIKVAFFNNNGGVGRTTLVYHLAHMMADRGLRVLMLDLDPQSNLTAMSVTEERLEEFWRESTATHPLTIQGAIQPISQGLGDLHEPHLEELRDGLAIVPGDPGLSTFEDKLSEAWPRALTGDLAASRTLSTFHRLADAAAQRLTADVVMLDVGPNLGAINRAALLAADLVVTPVAPDAFSIQGLRNLGPTLLSWRSAWKDRLMRHPAHELPRGDMRPLGYIVMQAGMRLSHPVRTYDRWVGQIPTEYHRAILHEDEAYPATTTDDPWYLGIMRHYQSLMPLARDAQKPMFHLRPADGAIGAQMDAVRRCREDFDGLTQALLRRVEALAAK